MPPVLKRLTPRRPSGAAARNRGRRPAKSAAEGSDAERRKPFRVLAPTTALGIRKAAKRDDLANGDQAAANANKKKNLEKARMLLCKLTDLELSGAPQCRTGVAGPRAPNASARTTG
jgi:hypothetical protein